MRSRLSYLTSSVDESRAFCDEFYHPISLDVHGRPDCFAFDVDAVRIGPLVVADVAFGAEVAIETGEVDSYHVDIALDGYAETGQFGNLVLAGAGTAAIYQPGDGVHMPRISPDCRLLGVEIERAGLEAELEALLGHPIRTPLSLPPSIDVSTGAGRSLVRLLGLVRAELYDAGGLIDEPLVADQLWHGVLTGLLLAADHPYREELTGPASPSRPRHVKRAIEAMQADPARPVTIHDLARLAGVSVRGLQEGFHRHVGMSPMAYLRRLRLARAHDDLRLPGAPDEPGAAGRVASETVAAVARRWGFAHLGRFAAAYRREYGRSPAETLRLTLP